VDLAESLSRVLNASQLLGEAFYRHLFELVPEVRPYFERVDMRRQAMLVTMALTIIQQYYDRRYPAMKAYLHYLGSRHAARGIPIDLYSRWRDTLIDTLARFHGNNWSDDIAGHWRRAIDLAIDKVVAGYAEHCQI
jgi:hemoglobin-like flavoprotein